MIRNDELALSLSRERSSETLSESCPVGIGVVDIDGLATVHTDSQQLE